MQLETSPPSLTDLLVIERGPWLATSLGGMWSIEHPHPRDVFIEDIAAGLSRTCRYGGQIKKSALFYSVAEHCVLMTDWAMAHGIVRSREEGLKLLLHDASEAYLGDIPSPLKVMLPDYRRLEDRAQSVIERAFGLDRPMAVFPKAIVKEIDLRIRFDEREHLIENPALLLGKTSMRSEHGDDLEPLGVRLSCLDPAAAQRDFLGCFERVCTLLPSADPQNRAVDVQLARVQAFLNPQAPAYESSSPGF